MLDVECDAKACQWTASSLPIEYSIYFHFSCGDVVVDLFSCW